MTVEQALKGQVELSPLLEQFEAACETQRTSGLAAPLTGKLVINIERSLWCKLLDEPLALYYQPRPDPVRQIRFQLRMQLYGAEHFPLCAQPLHRFIFPDVGLALLPSLFGAPMIFRDEVEPAWENVVIVPDGEEPPESVPDFERAGLMPAVLACHRGMRELLGEGWNVGFPDWCRGPLGTVAYLRGEENIYLDLMINPEYSRRMMDYGMRARREWLWARARLLGQTEPGPAVLFNDDVSAENLSPETYRQQVLPFERQLYEFHGGHIGYHSCGNLTPFMRDIKTLGPLDFFHVSAWTDLREAVKVFHPDTRLFVTLHPVRDVLGASPEHIRERLKTIKDCCAGGPFTILMTELMTYHSLKEDLEAIHRALEIAAEVLAD